MYGSFTRVRVPVGVSILQFLQVQSSTFTTIQLVHLNTIGITHLNHYSLVLLNWYYSLIHLNTIGISYTKTAWLYCWVMAVFFMTLNFGYHFRDLLAGRRNYGYTARNATDLL